MGVNDWFDPVFLQKRIEKLMRYNDVDSAAGSIEADSIEVTSNRE